MYSDTFTEQRHPPFPEDKNAFATELFYHNESNALEFFLWHTRGVMKYWITAHLCSLTAAEIFIDPIKPPCVQSHSNFVHHESFELLIKLNCWSMG